MDLCLIISAPDLNVPELTDDNLFLFYKPLLSELLLNPNVIFLGEAPDNTADNQDDLLIDGYLFRIICPQKYVSLSINSFRELIQNTNPFWGTIIIEKGFIKTETTIEFLYK